MEIRITYVGTLNGIKGMWCGFRPEGAIITEARNVLYPSEGYILKNKITGEEEFSVWLKDGDTQENYIEEEYKEEEDADN